MLSRGQTTTVPGDDVIGEHADLVVEPGRKSIECGRLAMYQLARTIELPATDMAGLRADAHLSRRMRALRRDGISLMLLMINNLSAIAHDNSQSRNFSIPGACWRGITFS